MAQVAVYFMSLPIPEVPQRPEHLKRRGRACVRHGEVQPHTPYTLPCVILEMVQVPEEALEKSLSFSRGKAEE